MAQTIPFQSDQYLSRSWKMLTRDKGWIKPVLLLAVGSFVPIVGLFALLGYALEWARLTAWGAATAPKQRDIQVGECIKSGARAFVVAFVWMIPLGLISALLAWTGPFSIIVSGAVSVLVTVAMLRATIFQSITAGLQLNRIWEMVKHDWRGLGRILLANLVIAACVAVVLSIVFGMGLLFAAPGLADLFYDLGYVSGGTVDAGEALSITVRMIQSFAPSIILSMIIGTIVSTVTTLVITNAVGLWMLQFNVPAWGASEDPLPQPFAPLPPYGAAPAQQVVPNEGTITSSVRTAGGTVADVHPAAQAPAATYAPVAQAGQEPAPLPEAAPQAEVVETLIAPDAPAAEAPAAAIPVVPITAVEDAPVEDVPAEEAPVEASAKMDDETAQAEAYAEAMEAMRLEGEGAAVEVPAEEEKPKRTATRRSTTKKTTQASAEKPAAKKTTAKKAVAEDAAEDEAKPAKKATTRRSTAKKAEDAEAEKKPATRRAAAKKTTSTTAKKTTAKKAAAEAEAAAEDAAEKPAKKTTSRATAAKKPAAKKTTSAAAKEAATTTAKKTATRRSTAKKAAEGDAPEAEAKPKRTRAPRKSAPKEAPEATDEG